MNSIIIFLGLISIFYCLATLGVVQLLYCCMFSPTIFLLLRVDSLLQKRVLVAVA
jgi:hypothetical protein